MAYLHIDNLYKNQEIFMFKKVYALEKIHGTSAHIKWHDGTMTLFPGGEKLDNFKHAVVRSNTRLVEFEGVDDITKSLTNLEQILKETGIYSFIIFGEAYGGKCQGMKDTYGPDLRFIAFDINIGGMWLNVPDAQKLANDLGFEFVYWWETSTNIEEIDDILYKNSPQAKRNLNLDDKIMEGIVLRPLIELRKNNNERIIAKHKRAEFAETREKRGLNVEQIKVLDDARAIADEWVTEMRLTHVLDKIPQEQQSVENMRIIIDAMTEDIEREGKGEIVWSPLARKQVSNRTAMMFKRRLQLNLRKENAE